MAAVTPLLRAAMATHDAEKLATALAQAEARLGPALVELSAEYQLARKIVAELAAAAGAEPAARLEGALAAAAGGGSLEAKQVALSAAIGCAAKGGAAVPPEVSRAWREVAEAGVVASMLDQARSHPHPVCVTVHVTHINAYV